MPIQAKRQERNELAKKVRTLLDSTEGGEWTEANQAAYDADVARITALDEAIQREQKVVDIEASRVGAIQDNADRNGISVDEATAQAEAKKALYNKWLRVGEQGLSHDEIMNTMSTTTDSEGGYTVPDEEAIALLKNISAFGGMREAARVIQTATGRTMQWPTLDETAVEGEIVAENASVTNTDPSFGTKSMGVYKYSSKDVAVPFELLQDSGIDVAGEVNTLITERLARITNRHYTAGTGTAQPEGVVPASTLGRTAAAAALIGYTDIVRLEHSVDPAYRQMPGVRYMMHDDGLLAIKELVDTTGRPLWKPGLVGGDPDLIGRYPYTINQHMAAPGTGNISMLFGVFSKYLIRDVTSVQLFRFTDSAYTKKGQVGFLAFMRTGGALIDATNNAIRHLIHP